MFGKIFRTRHEELVASHDDVMLADGQMLRVQRANLAAAKALYAAQRAAERRMAERVAHRTYTAIYELDENALAERELLRAG